MAIARLIPVNRRIGREPRAQQGHSFKGLWFPDHPGVRWDLQFHRRRRHVEPSKCRRAISLPTLETRCSLLLSAKP